MTMLRRSIHAIVRENLLVKDRERENYGRDYELDQSEKGTDEDERNEEDGKDHTLEMHFVFNVRKL